MKSNKELVLQHFNNNADKKTSYTTLELSKILNISRANMSTLLNQLVNDGALIKNNSRPVCYKLNDANTNKESSFFDNLIGYDRSLKNAIQLSKAALMYPSHALHTMILGNQGCGKSEFIQSLINYINSRQQIDTAIIECQYIDENYKTDKKILSMPHNGLIIIEDIDCLNDKYFGYAIEQLIKSVSIHDKPMLICTCSNTISNERINKLRNFFPVQIQLPSITEREYDERIDLIKFSFHAEAQKITRNIEVEIDALRALALYQPQGDVKQLFKDIQIGCANAYVRCINQNELIHVLLTDFSFHVQKGFLLYKDKKELLDKILKQGHSYEFSLDKVYIHESKENENIYDFIDDKFKELQARSIDESSISAIILSDLKNKFQEYRKGVYQGIDDKEILTKIIDIKIINLVKDLLNDASRINNVVYSESVFYGLCLHISSLINKKSNVKHLSGEKVNELMNMHKELYELCSKYACRLQDEFNKELNFDEIVILALFLIEQDELKEHPVVLLAMHGERVASEMISIVKQLTQSESVYSFDMDLNKDMNTIYDQLMQKIQSIQKGKGVLFLYDMGSLKRIVDTISQETQIPIRTIELPSTLILLDAARKAEFNDDLDEVYIQVKSSLEKYYESIFNYSGEIRFIKKQVIITLCMSGEGGAIQMKKYIEKNINNENLSIIPLAVSDKSYLISQITELRKKSDILCIVGTYDPHLFHIPFIPVSRLFQTPPDMLEYLFSIENVTEIDEINGGIGFIREVSANLKDELSNIDVDEVVDMVVDVIKRLSLIGIKLTINQQVGFLMHVTCAVDRLVINEQSVYNTRTKTIISRKKNLYNDLKQLLKPLETEYCIQFNDSELANMLAIISQL